MIVSNDVQNEFDNQIIVIPLTSDETETIRSFEVSVNNTPENGLEKPSKVLCSRLQTIDIVVRLKDFVGKVEPEIMQQVDQALKTVLFLN